ncbi:hypothetical protein ACFSC4_00970 [Deinococcus malanensis]|uniref:hypothetical protein n=1 Tax=Deinococcus malanensis TaxID=1706855 RepID=UPI003639E8D4
MSRLQQVQPGSRWRSLHGHERFTLFRPLSPDRSGQTAGWNRNERLGILNGWAVFTGDGFMSVSVVVAGFAARLGAPNWVIGLLPAIAGGGWMLPQLLVAARVRPWPTNCRCTAPRRWCARRHTWPWCWLPPSWQIARPCA